MLRSTALRGTLLQSLNPNVVGLVRATWYYKTILMPVGCVVLTHSPSRAHIHRKLKEASLNLLSTTKPEPVVCCVLSHCMTLFKSLAEEKPEASRGASALAEHEAENPPSNPCGVPMV